MEMMQVILKLVKNKRAYAGALLVMLSLVLSSCVCPDVTETAKLSSQREQLFEEHNKNLIREVARLEQELAEKQKEIKMLVLSKQNSNREVVRTKAKLRSHSSKAETVANIAEVKSMLNEVGDRQMNDQQRQVVLEAEQVIVMSVEALNRGDVEKAFDLSSTAQQLIQPIRELQVQTFLNSSSDVVFVTPLVMKVLKTCNVRTAPGMTSNIQFMLESGRKIQALAYSKNWVQIESEQKGKGWVYSRLLEIIQ